MRPPSIIGQRPQSLHVSAQHEYPQAAQGTCSQLQGKVGVPSSATYFSSRFIDSAHWIPRQSTDRPHDNGAWPSTSKVGSRVKQRHVAAANRWVDSMREKAHLRVH